MGRITAKPELDDLAAETGELVNLLVEEHGRGVYLYRAEGQQSVEVDATIGHRVHLHNTALGKAILSELPRERVEEILDRYGLPATTERMITDREERLQGLNCVACAVTDNRGSVAGATSVSDPASRMRGEQLEEEFPERIQSVTNVVSLNLTYS